MERFCKRNTFLIILLISSCSPPKDADEKVNDSTEAVLDSTQTTEYTNAQQIKSGPILFGSKVPLSSQMASRGPWGNVLTVEKLLNVLYKQDSLMEFPDTTYTSDPEYLIIDLQYLEDFDRDTLNCEWFSVILTRKQTDLSNYQNTDAEEAPPESFDLFLIGADVNDPHGPDTFSNVDDAEIELDTNFGTTCPVVALTTETFDSEEKVKETQTFFRIDGGYLQEIWRINLYLKDADNDMVENRQYKFLDVITNGLRNIKVTEKINSEKIEKVFIFDDSAGAYVEKE